MAYEEVEPTCDICGVIKYSDESLEWNGDTGNHVHCEDASDIRAYNVRILHNDGSHERCDLTSDCRKGN